MVEAALDLMTESALDVTMVLHYASDDAVRTIAAHRLQLVGSDGIFGARPHPRLYGTAPRFLGRFSLREGSSPPRRRSPASRRAPQIASVSPTGAG